MANSFTDAIRKIAKGFFKLEEMEWTPQGKVTIKYARAFVNVSF